MKFSMPTALTALALAGGLAGRGGGVAGSRGELVEIGGGGRSGCDGAEKFRPPQGGNRASGAASSSLTRAKTSPPGVSGGPQGATEDAQPTYTVPSR